METLKREFLNLLDKDVEFRYAVAGYLGLSEILKRLDALAEEQIRLREEQTKIWMEIGKLREEQTRLAEEQVRLREEQTKIWDEIAKVWEEIKALREEQTRLREDMIAGFKRHDEEIAKLREDMIAGFRRHDEEIARLREDMIAGFKRHDEEIAKLREDMIEGFRLLRRHIDALGARWGIVSEEAFREGLRGLLKRDFGFRVEKWIKRDEQGFVYGYPSDVDIDVAVHDGKIILIEVKSHIDNEDVYNFRRKCEFYRIMEGREPERRIIVTPYADEEALKTAEKLGIEVYTKI
jgi:hypothetical protein